MTQPRKTKKSQEKERLTLAGLDFDLAVRVTLATGKAPPPPKKAKPEGKK